MSDLTDRPFTVQHIDHVVLRTEQMQAMAGFYQTLGAQVKRDALHELGMLQLQLGQSMIDLVDVAGRLGQAGGAAPGPEGRNVDHMALRIAPFDEDAIIEFCQAHDIQSQRIDHDLLGADGYGPAVYVTDPDGNKVELKGSRNEAV